MRTFAVSGKVKTGYPLIFAELARREGIIVQTHLFSTSHSYRLFVTAGFSNILMVFIIESLMKRLNYTNELTLHLKLNMRPNMF